MLINQHLQILMLHNSNKVCRLHNKDLKIHNKPSQKSVTGRMKLEIA